MPGSHNSSARARASLTGSAMTAACVGGGCDARRAAGAVGGAAGGEEAPSAAGTATGSGTAVWPATATAFPAPLDFTSAGCGMSDHAFLMARHAFWPPKPNELLSASSMPGASRGPSGM